MGTTPIYNLPYPESTALVKDGATAIQSLAQAVESAIPSGGEANTGRNAIINGGFDIWQRGTTFTPASGTYTADRFQISFNGSGATRTISRQAFTPGSAPQSGYEAPYFFRYDQSVAGTSGTFSTINHNFEDVRLLAGRTVRVSIWAKSASNTQFAIGFSQNFGSGGSSSTFTGTANFTTSTSWQRFSASLSIPSLSGKTIGTNAYSLAYLNLPINSTFTLDFWGFQVEPGSVTTRFEELQYAQILRNCQRYYYKAEVNDVGDHFGSGFNKTTTVGMFFTSFPVSMRVAPTALEQTGTAANYSIAHANTSTAASAVPTFESATVNGASTNITVAAGLTAGQGSMARAANTAAYLAWSAEL